METINIKLQVRKLNEVEPLYVMRQPMRLELNVEIDKQAIAKIIFDSLDDFTFEELNNILKKDGILLTSCTPS